MTQLNIINHNDNLISVTQKGRYLIELLEDINKRSVVAVFNPENGYEEILGEGLEVSPFVETCNAIWKSKDFYFSSSEINDDGKFLISIYRYSSQTRTYDIYYSFEEEDLHNINKKIKIFILSDNVLLIQNETTVSEIDESIMGGMQFEQRIIDIDTGSVTEIKDENIKNNGVNTIIPISPTQIVTKTGFSYIEDKRLEIRSEESALIESIFLHTTSRFIADLMIQAPTIDADLLESAYFNKYIIKPQLSDGYLYYTVLSPDDCVSESVFVNIDTRERLTCKNDKIDKDDLDTSYIINKTPYVKNTALIETRFLNLKTMEFDLSSMGMEFLDIVGNVIVLCERHKKNRPEMLFYHYPDMNLLLSEKGQYITGINKNDRYYFFVQK